jgi:ATP/maltotriose-dependent transcriptional regulator MalT
MDGNFDAARGLVAESKSILSELGLRTTLASATQISGMVEMLAGDAKAAETEYRLGDDMFADMNERLYRTTSAPLLARALFEQGRLEEADRYVTLAAEIAGDDVSSKAEWGAVRARLLSRGGTHADAEHLAREVVDIAATSGEPQQHADSLMDLGQILLAAGKPDEGVVALRQARTLYQQKGVQPRLDEVRRVLQRAGAASSA